MPYIGRNHIAGDHTSNFKVLDDISSYTATFNGSSATIISTADETIRIPEHRFIQGQRVTYTNGGGGNIGGLTTGTAYFVTFDNHNRIKLATSLSNANNNTNINLSSVGSGSAHTLTAAFDGVNKTFKATHSGGLDVNINNSTQLNIAINNVIQKPNNDASYTEGFRVVDHEKIQFQVAPTADDVFWGTVIANTIETFDISDLKIDNFTGDGSTTDFVLSREVPNNESLMVTLDGVLQHPSDQNVSRAYIVVVPNNIIQFTAAPGNGVEVQVRHLGFAGAATGEVSGFYGRTGNVVLGSGDNIIVGGINATGIITTPQLNVGSNIKLGNAGVITATSFVGSGAALTGIDATSIKDSSGNIKIQAQASGAVYTGIHTFTTLKSTSADFSGSVSIGGTLTYEDVTNIDSVGVITARDNIKVGTGVTIESNGQATFVGVVTFGSGSTTIDNNVVNVGTALTLGHTQGLQFHTQNLHSAGFEVNQINSSGIITATTFKGNGDFVELDVDGHTNLDNLNIAGVSTFTGTLNATNISATTFIGNGDFVELDVDGHTNLDNLNIAGVTTMTGNLNLDYRLIHNGDADTYMEFPAANRIRFATANQNRLEIREDGRIVTHGYDGDRFIFNHDMGHGARNIQIYAVSDASTWHSFIGTNLTHDGTNYIKPSDNGNENWGNTSGIVFEGANSAGAIAMRFVVDQPGENGLNYSLGAGNSGKTAAIDNKTAAFFNAAGHFIPGTDSTKDLGLTGTRWRNLYADTLYGNGANLTGIEAFVTGMILLWSGSAGSIPSGFVLCNGSNSTPDLRGRFVVGYHDSNGDYDVNDTGGATTVTLAESQIPSHSHSTNNHNHSFSSSHTHGVSGSVSGSTNTTGNHSHTWQRQDTVINNGYRPWPASNNDCGVSNQNTSSNGNHSHTFSGSFSVTSGSGTASGTTGNANPSTNNTGGGGSHENRPPYYALCYIMKT
jgi:microcystin-dependent protein